MSADRDYILKEAKLVRKTVNLIDPLLARTRLDQYELIALGSLLQDLYSEFLSNIPDIQKNLDSYGLSALFQSERSSSDRRTWPGAGGVGPGTNITGLLSF